MTSARLATTGPRPAPTGPQRTTSSAQLVRILLGQRLRRDRLQLLFWIGGTALLALFAAVAVAQSYGDAAARETESHSRT